METGEFWRLGRVSDERLRSRLAELLASGYRTEARIIAHIAEVEQRKLYLRDGSESLFAYCLSRLGLSESEAFHRITAARIARKFPIVFTLVEKRELHLSAVCLLRDYLTPENHGELLAAASGKTKLQIQEMLATRFPRPDVESRIRKLPTPAPAPAVDTKQVTTPQPAPTIAGPAPVETPKQPPSASGSQMPVRGLIQPTSEARYRIQLNASAALKEKLDLLQALTSHANPSGDLAALIERAVDLAIEQAQRKRFAKTERPREQGSRRLVKGVRSSIRRAHIPNATRREVVERDGTRCAFVSKDGHRCTARAFLQIHHQQAWARGGSDDRDNLQVLCGRHNRLLAEHDFGARHIAEKLEARRTASSSRSSELFEAHEDSTVSVADPVPAPAQHPPQDTSGRFVLTRSAAPSAKLSSRPACE